MIKNNLLLAIRHLLKFRINSLVNIGGLTISLTALILLGTYVYRELNTDRFHEKSDRIYAVSFSDSKNLLTPAILSKYINNSVPGIEKTVRCLMFLRNFTTVRYAGNLPVQSKIIFADSTLFDAFSFKCIEGKLTESLNSPNSMVITRSEAKKLFGEESPVGKTLMVAEKGELTITAMIEDLPVNSSFDFTGIANLNSVRLLNPSSLDGGWQYSSLETYILLTENQDAAAVQKRINDRFGALLKDHDFDPVTLLPYKDIYFDNQVKTELRHGNIKLIRILVLISLLIVLIAVINYVNLSTSQTGLHSQTTGIKKLFGAARTGLIGQFIMESALISLISFLLAVTLSNLLFPVFNQLIGTSLTGIAFFSKAFWFGMLGTGIVLGTLAGVYPAYLLTAVSPIMMIKNEIKKGKRAAGFRRGLIVFQFSVSIILVACTLIINSQLKYVTTSNPGFSKENLLLIRMSPKLTGKFEVLKQSILQSPSVKDVAFSRSYPGNIMDHTTATVYENGENKKFLFTTQMIEPGYLEMMGMKMLSGRSFQEDIKSEIGAFIVNETAVREFGLKDPLNAQIAGSDGIMRPIVGIVKDYHFESLYNPIKPLVLACGENRFTHATVRFQVRNAEEMDKMISSLKKSYTSLDSSFPFEMKWFDETVEQMYLQEKSLKALILMFSSLAIFVACLGLFALSLYETESKGKEIGIRKVNGAKISEVLFMLNKDFVKWIAIAFVVATPIAWFAMHKWLGNFAYKISLSWWIFALAGLMALGIAILTVSWQSWKAATRNPVEALRYE